MEENNSIHIQWIDGKEMFAVWDEADMLLGYYDTKEEAENAFVKYCNYNFPEYQNCDKCAKNERKWEFRYERQWKKQKELESTISKLRKQIRELKNG